MSILLPSELSQQCSVHAQFENQMPHNTALGWLEFRKGMIVGPPIKRRVTHLVTPNESP